MKTVNWMLTKKELKQLDSLLAEANYHTYFKLRNSDISIPQAAVTFNDIKFFRSSITYLLEKYDDERV